MGHPAVEIVGGALSCNRCGEVKPTSEFHRHKQRKCGFSSECKECVRPRQKAYYDANQSQRIASVIEWGKKNPERRLANKKAHYHRNKASIIPKQTAYAKANAEKISARQKEWREKNEVELRERRKRNRIERPEMVKKWEQDGYRKKAADPAKRMILHARARLWQAVKCQGARKSGRTLTLLGCTREELKAHIERQFKPGMSWGNYRHDVWHIDHIRPCASFDMFDAEQQRQCFHYTNLQPLWAVDNLRKADKLPN